MLVGLSLIVGLIAGIWRRGWTIVGVWVALVVLAVVAEIRSEDGMSIWLVPLAGAVALGIGAAGFTAVRFLLHRAEAIPAQ